MQVINEDEILAAVLKTLEEFAVEKKIIGLGKTKSTNISCVCVSQNSLIHKKNRIVYYNHHSIFTTTNLIKFD